MEEGIIEINTKWIIIVALFIIIILAFFVGTWIYGVHAPKGYTDTDFYYFKAGYHDSYINIIRGFIMNCTPYSLRVIEEIDYTNKPLGLLYWCQKPEINLTLPIRYSPLYYKKDTHNGSKA